MKSCRRFIAPLFQFKFRKRLLVRNVALIWKTSSLWLRKNSAVEPPLGSRGAPQNNGCHSLNEPPGYNIHNATRPLRWFWRETLRLWCSLVLALQVGRLKQREKKLRELLSFKSSLPRQRAQHAPKWLTHGRKCRKVNLTHTRLTNSCWRKRIRAARRGRNITGRSFPFHFFLVV